MAPNQEEERTRLLAWYAALRPLTVDIVGEFAGRELFAIHGESLIRHCLEEAKVDFDGRFSHSMHIPSDSLLTFSPQMASSSCTLSMQWSSF